MPAKKKSQPLPLFARVRRMAPRTRGLVVAAAALSLAIIAVSWQMASPSADPNAGAGAGKKAPRAAQVGVDAVISQSRKQTVPVIGRFVARQAGVVAARINGPIAEFRVEVGDRVKAGDTIAVLVSDTLEWRHKLQIAEEQQYQAAVRTGKARIKFRRQELKRLERLKKSAAFSQARLDDKRQEVVVAESQLAEAQGKLAGARANRKLTEINLYNATVRAPYSGVVSRRHTEVGAYVQIGQPVVTLVNDSGLEIEAEVPASRTMGLAPGTQVSVFINGEKKFNARVRAVVPEENTQTRTRTVRFVPDLPAVLPPGLNTLASNQSVTLRLPAGQNGIVVTVHKDAILNRKGNTLVVLAKDGKATIQPVRLGVAVGTRFIVLGGLQPGDMVVVRGNERLIPGQAIKFKIPTPGVKG